MKKTKGWRKLAAMVLSLLVFLSALPVAAAVAPLLTEPTESTLTEPALTEPALTEPALADLAEVQEVAEQGNAGDMIAIQSDWQGSVFGDVGGQDKVTAENFTIRENGDGTVTIRASGDRGKIAAGSEGIAYYFKGINPQDDYELTASVHVDHWGAAHNQISFGLMLRGDVLLNEHAGSAYTGNYAAAGALDQRMKAFYKTGGSLIKNGLDYDGASAPGHGEAYRIGIKKTGNVLLFTVNGESKAVETVDEYRYAGLFAARNAVVTFSDIVLKQGNGEPPIELGEWSFSAFGGNTSGERNPPPIIGDDGSLSLSATGGKIAAGDEGMSFVYKPIPAGANFELKARVTVQAFNQNGSISSPNQKSFGLMLRETIGEDGDSAVQTAPYAAAGALDTVMKGFYKQDGIQAKLEPFQDVNAPAPGESYWLSIRKAGQTIVLEANGKSEVVVLNSALQGSLYAGLFVARDASVKFEEYSITVDERKVVRLEADSSAMKTSYRIGEILDLEGLQVKAVFSDGGETELKPGDYVVTGFDSGTAGDKAVTVHYGGAATTVDVTIGELELTALRIKFQPAKTDYFPGDNLSLLGLVVEAEFDGGYRVEELLAEDYAVTVDGVAVSPGIPYVLEEAGEKNVEVTAISAPLVKAAFKIMVKSAAIEALVVNREPVKKVYFAGDELRLDGLVLHALYNDGSEVRLRSGEFEVSGFRTDEPGSVSLIFTHKGKTVSLAIIVKEREVTGIQITDYPKTTYRIGESFDPQGLAVAKRYDDGTLEAYNEYRLETTGFDGSRPGVYTVLILPGEEQLRPIELQATVREETEIEWKSIRFGQSTSNANNMVNRLADGTVELIALEGGGKVTADHDGISYYYAELDAGKDNFTLSADIKVNAYAKSPHDGQESFGLMARDVIGEPNTSSVFASNMAAVGGYSGGTRLDNGTQLFARTGVESPDGAGSKGIEAIMLYNERPGPANTSPAAPYRLTLTKTNSGFSGKLNNGREEMLFVPDILSAQDGEKMHVGFFAARLASIEVSGIELSVTAAESDPPQVLPEPEPVEPKLDILSRDKTSGRDYGLVVRPNVDGIVTVKQGGAVLAGDLRAAAGEPLEIAARLDAQADSSFSISFLPEDTQLLTTYEELVYNFRVTMKTYRGGGDIYVSPAGTPGGDGTEQYPLDLDTAVEFVQPGQTIVVLDGRYVRNAGLQIVKYNDGSELAMKSLVAAPGARPVIDFDKKSEGVVLSGDYWHIKGLDFARSAGNTKGFTVGGSHNVVENSRFYEHGDTGLQISRTDTSEDDPAKWPSFNLILNSTSFDNRDPSDNNADGFAAKLTSGTGNVFRGCIAHNNIDDGWDLYTKAGTGAIGAVLIENSIAFNNGFLQNGSVGAGDKNGFKLGGEGIHVPHVIRGSMAFGNGAYGFTSNSNPGVVAVDNIAFDNARGNLSFTTYPGIATDFTIDGFVSFQATSKARDQYPASLQAANNYLFDGSASVNSLGTKLTEANFASLEPVSTYGRDENGDIVWGDFLRFIAPVKGGDGGEGGGEEPPASGGYHPVIPPLSGIKLNEDGSVAIEAAASEVSGERKVSISEFDLRSAMEKAKPDAEGKKTIHIRVDGGYGGTAAEGSGYVFSLPAGILRQASAAGVELRLHAPGIILAVPTSIMGEGQLAAAGRVDIAVALSPEPNRRPEFNRLPDPASSGALPSGTIAQTVYLSVMAAGGEPNVERLAQPIGIALAHSLSDKGAHARLGVYRLSTDGKSWAEKLTDFDYDATSERLSFEASRAGEYVIFEAAPAFLDVPEQHWAYREISELAARGIVRGVSDANFRPEQGISRADFALLLVRALKLAGADGFGIDGLSDGADAGNDGADDGNGNNGNNGSDFGGNDSNASIGGQAMAQKSIADVAFRDVSKGAYYAEELELARQYGLVRGNGDGFFRPEERVSRQDMFVMAARLLRVAGYSELDKDGGISAALDRFVDRADIAGYAAKDMATLADAGLLRGDHKGKANPNGQSSRAEAAALIHRLLSALEKPDKVRIP